MGAAPRQCALSHGLVYHKIFGKEVHSCSIAAFILTEISYSGKTGQIAHVSSPFSGIAQKTIIARHTAEAAQMIGAFTQPGP